METPLGQHVNFAHQVFALVAPGELGGHQPPLLAQVEKIMVFLAHS